MLIIFYIEPVQPARTQRYSTTVEWANWYVFIYGSTAVIGKEHDVNTNVNKYQIV